MVADEATEGVSEGARSSSVACKARMEHGWKDGVTIKKELYRGKRDGRLGPILRVVRVEGWRRSVVEPVNQQTAVWKLNGWPSYIGSYLTVNQAYFL